MKLRNFCNGNCPWQHNIMIAFSQNAFSKKEIKLKAEIFLLIAQLLLLPKINLFFNLYFRTVQRRTLAMDVLDPWKRDMVKPLVWTEAQKVLPQHIPCSLGHRLITLAQVVYHCHRPPPWDQQYRVVEWCVENRSTLFWEETNLLRIKFKPW